MCLQQCSHSELGLLLLKGQDARGRTPLHYSMLYQRNDIAHVLVKGGAPKDVADAQGQTPLDVAISLGHIHDEKLLVRLSTQ
jgi:ankyrin repeat protein